jgi:hypothetical protein
MEYDKRTRTPPLQSLNFNFSRAINLFTPLKRVERRVIGARKKRPVEKANMLDRKHEDEKDGLAPQVHGSLKGSDNEV